MIIIGELLNSTREIIKEKLKTKDVDYITQLACQQEEQGADFIDINAGEFSEKETEYLSWMIEKITPEINIPLSIDSSDPEVIISILENYDQEFLVNSISAETERYEKLVPVIKKYNNDVIALCMDDSGAIPQKPKDKIEVAEKLIDKLLADNIKPEKIYIDPLLQPVSVQPKAALNTIKAIEKISNFNKDINIICGLSNVSFGLPKRKLLNQSFLIMALSHGLNSVIVDPLDEYLMALLKASQVLTGEDNYGMEYLKALRADKLEV